MDTENFFKISSRDKKKKRLLLNIKIDQILHLLYVPSAICIWNHFFLSYKSFFITSGNIQRRKDLHAMKLVQWEVENTFPSSTRINISISMQNFSSQLFLDLKRKTWMLKHLNNYYVTLSLLHFVKYHGIQNYYIFRKLSVFSFSLLSFC